QDDLQGWGQGDQENWAKMYSSIRKANVFFENVDKVIFDASLVDGVLLKNRLLGEAYFLRAFYYNKLVNMYGGVPLIKTTFGLTDEFKIARNSFSECVDFMVKDLDLAVSLLPLTCTGNNRGRATKGAALALKSEILLYAASDLHKNNVLFSSFSKPDLLGYTSGTPNDRWTAAKNAAKAVIDLGKYNLYKANPAPGDDISQNYTDIFLVTETEEDIYVRFFVDKYRNNYGNTLVLSSGPNGYHLYGQNTPTGNLVDDYEMKDGTPFSWNNPAHSVEPYKNRDPRFYSTVLYDGVKWIPRNTDGIAIDPIGIVQTGTWEVWNSKTNKMEEVFGLDTRSSPIEPWNGGYTGYYLRKFCDPKVDGRFTSQNSPWRYFRYAKILLNYAEACIELGQEGEARTYINMIRKRAGMKDITESGTALRAKYRHERRIELAMEDDRFFDVRRWAIGPEAYVDATGVDIRYKLNADHTTAKIPTIKPIVIQTRKWSNKAYFFPITRSEMSKNDLLVQNPGY
ncbi:MAG: RagB/SusD family nutrient uptake outer membrane protein, partial [Mariniphaga sp.]